MTDTFIHFQVRQWESCVCVRVPFFFFFFFLFVPFLKVVVISKKKELASLENKFFPFCVGHFPKVFCCTGKDNNKSCLPCTELRTNYQVWPFTLSRILVSSSGIQLNFLDFCELIITWFVYRFISHVLANRSKWITQPHHNISMVRNVRKRTFGHVRPTKTRISLRIRAVWSKSPLSASRINQFFTIKKNALSEKSDQTERMLSLIWIFTGRTCSKVRFLTLQSVCLISANGFIRQGLFLLTLCRLNIF